MKYFIFTLIIFISFLNANNSHSLSEKVQESTSSFYKKNLRKLCRSSSANLAQRHTIKEWKSLENTKQFIKELLQLCPHSSSRLSKVIRKSIHQQKLSQLHKFAIYYAKDSGRYSSY